MNLKSIAKNQAELTFTKGSYKITVLFSYQTAVAIHIKAKAEKILVTDTKYSSTTTRHINQFSTRYNGEKETIKQENINNIIKSYLH